MTIEDTSLDNLKELAALKVELWPESDFDEELQNCELLLLSVNEACFLARVDNQYVGFIQLSLRADYVEGASTAPVAYVEGLYVRPSHRKAGVARRLIEFGLAWGKEMGCVEYASDAEWQNESSIRFHKHLGFEEVGRTVHFLRRIP